MYVCIFPGKLWNPRSTSFWEPWDVLYLDVDEHFSFSCSWKLMSSDGLLRLVTWNKILTQVMWEVMNKLNQIIPPFVRIDRIRMSYYYYWTSKSIFSQITSWLLLPQVSKSLWLLNSVQSWWNYGVFVNEVTGFHFISSPKKEATNTLDQGSGFRGLT